LGLTQRICYISQNQINKRRNGKLTMVAININAKRRPSCSKWKTLLIATAAALVSISFVQVAQPVSTVELKSISSFQQRTTAEKSESKVKASLSLSDELHPPRPSYHVIFSTGCSSAQNWQSFFFFYHALAVQQPGNVTRIASGCTTQQQIELMHFHERYIHSMSHNFLLHFTPDYSTLRLDERWGSSSDHTYK
jgi:hypothetical protein